MKQSQAPQEDVMRQNRISKRVSIFLACALVAFTLMLLVVFDHLYRSAKDNIIQIQLNKVQTTAAGVNFYLDTAINALTYSRQSMMLYHQEGADRETLLSSMMLISDTFMTYIEDNIAGIYGYIYGEYLDGHGWVPDASFVPTERPWYTEAFAHYGEIVYTPPYVDAESGQTCITLSQTLKDDPRSVIAFDLALTSLQSSMEAALDSPIALTAAIIDRDKQTVIVSSGADSIGLDSDASLLSTFDPLTSACTELTINGVKSLVFIVPLTTGWDFVCVYDSEKLLDSLKYIYFSPHLGFWRSSASCSSRCSTSGTAVSVWIS